MTLFYLDGGVIFVLGAFLGWELRRYVEVVFASRRQYKERTK